MEGREKEKERNINLLFHLLIHSLVDSCMCPDQESNPQPWHIILYSSGGWAKNLILELILTKLKRCFPTGQRYEVEYKKDVSGKMNIIARLRYLKCILQVIR